MTGIRIEIEKDQHPQLAGPARGGPLTSFEKIDICRGAFAFLVVIAHTLDIAIAIGPDVPDRFGPAHALIRHGVGNGVTWVIGFFVISGYCIHLSVARLVGRGDFPLRQYFWARLTRILPLYYAALIVAGVAEWLMRTGRPGCWNHGLDAESFVAQVLMVQNLSQTFGSFGSSWSLTNEMFYYLLYAPIVCLALRWGMRAPRLGMLICLGMTLAMEVAYFGIWRCAFFRAAGLLFGLGMIWFMGALAADARAAVRGWPPAGRIAAAWPAVVAAGLAMLCSRRVHDQAVYLVLGVGFTLMLVRFTALDAAAGSAAGPRRPAAAALIRGMGLASYPTYLLHGPVAMLAGAALMRSGLAVDWRLAWAMLAAVGIGTGVAMGYLAEAPIMAWRAAFLKRLASAPAASVAPAVRPRTTRLGIAD